MQTSQATVPVVDDVLEPEPTSLARQLMHPAVPVSIHELAALQDVGLAVLDKRLTILETARTRSIRATSPEDWVLFKSPDGRITGYLQDGGCRRAVDIWGIDVVNVRKPKREPSADGATFAILIRGDGESRLTGQKVVGILGGRSSDEDFCKDKTGVTLEVAVEKAARANLDGNIARRLMGLQAVPLEALLTAWEGTKKSIEHCRKGRGFGSQSERLGAPREGVPDVTPPTCPVCKDADGTPLPLLYRAGKDGKKSFFGCRNWDKHKTKKVIVDADQWVAQQEKNAREVQQDAQAQAAEREDAKRQDAAIAAKERQTGEEG